MLTLLSPAGLWALAALGLPLALHLWRRPARTLRWGSLRFLERSTNRWRRDLRWHERLLLVVRLLLLALLALMLTRPHWRPVSMDRPQHWALIDPNAALEGDSLDHLRALQTAGYETHSLAPSFPMWTGNTHDTFAPDLWSLLREADAGLPLHSKLAVFTPGRLASLRGERPALSRCQINWVITPDRAAVEPAQRLPATALSVLILHDASRADDARYLAAAVRAVQEVSGRKIVLTESLATQAATALRADWVFWLGEQPPLEALTGNVRNLVTDAEVSTGAVDSTPGWIVAQPGTAGADTLANPVRLWRRISAAVAQADAVVWTDGFGHPLLTESAQGEHRRWRFFSRFQPDWTDLPRTTALPAWLRSLLLPETNASLFADPMSDLRRADPAQLATASVTAAQPAISLPLHRDTPGLQGWCWLFAALCFGLERLLSHRERSAGQVPASAHRKQAQPELAR